MQRVNSLSILLVDSEPDRKQRILQLKKEGFKVYPALDLQQAAERCRPGKYDLIVVNGRTNSNLALEVCDRIIGRNRGQLLLLIVTPEVRVSHRTYRVLNELEELVGSVKAMLPSGVGQDVPSLAA